MAGGKLRTGLALGTVGASVLHYFDKLTPIVDYTSKAVDSITSGISSVLPYAGDFAPFAGVGTGVVKGINDYRKTEGGFTKKLWNGAYGGTEAGLLTGGALTSVSSLALAGGLLSNPAGLYMLGAGSTMYLLKNYKKVGNVINDYVFKPVISLPGRFLGGLKGFGSGFTK